MSEPQPEASKEQSESGDGATNLPAIAHELEPILELLPEEKRPQALLLMTRVVSRSYRGPVPQAEDMAKYKAVDATFPERFVQIAEREQGHRHTMDIADQRNDFELRKSGQWMAFAALLIMLAVILALVFMGESVVAGIIAGATMISVVGIFALGRYYEFKSDQTNLDA